MRIPRLFAGAVLPALLSFASCSGNNRSGDDLTALPDAPVSDVWDLTVPEAQPEEGAAADIPADLPPAHRAVFEEMNHPGCVPDGPYLVDRVKMVRTPQQLSDLDVRAILPVEGKLWVGTRTNVFVNENLDWEFTEVDLPEWPVYVEDLEPAGGGHIWVAAGMTLVELDQNGEVVSSHDWNVEIMRVFACDSATYAVGGVQLVHLEGQVLKPVDPAPPGDQVSDGACLADVPYVGTTSGLWKLAGGQWQAVWEPEGGAGVRVVTAEGDFIAAATPDAVAVIQNDDVIDLWRPEPGRLPTGKVHSLAISSDGSTLAVGHNIGASLIHRNTGKVEHFHSHRWLPGEFAQDVALTPDGDRYVLWVGTTNGLSRLHKEEIFIEDKAEYMLDELDQWYWRMDGFVTAQAGFTDPWDGKPNPLYDDDNDGQWTEELVGAACYAYAVTGDEKYYETAKKAVKNMLMLIDVPAADFEAAGLGRGFITRSLVRDDEGPVFESKATQSNWHLVDYSDGHQYYWKDDTSSDETTGHFYGLPLYYDLCAKDDEEREWVAEHITALAGYILDHGYTLPDLDGEPTTHGDWSPDKIPIALDGLDVCMENGYNIVDCVGAWGGGGFLDSLEILGHMLAAWHVSGEQRFLDAYEELVTTHRYGEVAMFTKDAATWTEKGLANYCDHELADLAFLTLIRYDPYPERRAMWTKSMFDAWQYEVEERNPLKALAMAAALTDSPGLEAGVETLVDYPSDLRDWLVDNSHRLDAEPDKPDRHQDPQFKTVLPYDEIPIQRWDHNPYGVKGGGDGSSRKSPAFWLLPYWGLRYYNAICP